MKAAFSLLGALFMLSLPLRGQGLLGIGRQSDYKESVPLTFAGTVFSGYDRINYSDPLNRDVSSPFVDAGVGLIYSSISRITKLTTAADFSTLYYFDGGPGDKNTYYNTRASVTFEHQLSRRFSVADNFYAAYEMEPDFTIGMSNSVPSGQYFYGYNNFAVSYAWSERLATTAGYTIAGIKYQDDDLAQLDDRISNLFSLQFSYKLTRRTVLTAEYRFEHTSYTGYPVNQFSPNYTAHYLLTGVDHAWSPTLTASARVGAEFYDSDRTQETAPYLEAALVQALSRRSSLRWYNQLGFDGSQIGLYDSRYSFRTGVIATRQFTEKISGSVGVNYVYSNYQGNDAVPGSNENEINASVGMNYRFTRKLSAQASYTFSTISSDISFNDYDRHYTTLGLNASF